MVPTLDQLALKEFIENTKDIIKTSPLDVPVRAIVVTERVNTIK